MDVILPLWTTPFGVGFALSFSLILAIGAQNAFVLRQGLMRQHIAALVLFCALSDAMLIIVGVGGIASSMPLLVVIWPLGARSGPRSCATSVTSGSNEKRCEQICVSQSGRSATSGASGGSERVRCWCAPRRTAAAAKVAAAGTASKASGA